MPGLMGEGPIQAVAKIWGERKAQRRTKGTAHRTRAVLVLNATADHLAAIDPLDPLAADLRKLATDFAESWAGEHGWDTERLTDAIAAATKVSEVKANPPPVAAP